jgi:hypothetical protein
MHCLCVRYKSIEVVLGQVIEGILKFTKFQTLHNVFPLLDPSYKFRGPPPNASGKLRNLTLIVHAIIVYVR